MCSCYLKSRSESPSGVGFDDFAKFVHIFSSLVLTEIRLSFKFISTFIRMKKKIINPPLKSFSDQRCRKGNFSMWKISVSSSPWPTCKREKCIVYLFFFLDLVILLVPQHIPFEETVRYSPAKHPQIEECDCE